MSRREPDLPLPIMGRSTLPVSPVIKSLDNDLNAYPGGYHAGDAVSLSHKFANLAATNIKSGVRLFGVDGSALIQDVSPGDAAVGEVLSGKKFFSVTGGVKTGTLATVALDPAQDAYPAGYHAGAASLHAVDADLVPGNIKNGVQIFGVNGSFVGTGEDTTGDTAVVANVANGKTFHADNHGQLTGIYVVPVFPNDGGTNIRSDNGGTASGVAYATIAVAHGVAVDLLTISPNLIALIRLAMCGMVLGLVTGNTVCYLQWYDTGNAAYVGNQSSAWPNGTTSERDCWATIVPNGSTSTFVLRIINPHASSDANLLIFKYNTGNVPSSAMASFYRILDT